jgi:hypothetical protein
MRKHFERSDTGLIEILFRDVSRGTEENYENLQAVGGPADIRTENLPNVKFRTLPLCQPARLI